MLTEIEDRTRALEPAVSRMEFQIKKVSVQLEEEALSKESYTGVIAQQNRLYNSLRVGSNHFHCRK